MKDIGLQAVTEEGNKVCGPVLEPLFTTLFPAFQHKAEAIRIVAKNEGVTADYSSNGKVFILTVHDDFHPFVASSRIRILSGMSIVPGDLQHGKMRVCFGNAQLEVNIQITRIDGCETVTMEPQWKC